jgi:hypothetical protein
VKGRLGAERRLPDRGGRLFAQLGDRLLAQSTMQAQFLNLCGAPLQGFTIGDTDAALGFYDAGSGTAGYASGLNESSHCRFIFALRHDLHPLILVAVSDPNLKWVRNILCKIDG